jgi:dipeptidyl aminopeptidase/acylaminoacyl peptidase
VDQTGATPPVAVARYRIGNDAFSTSADGKTVVILARGAQSLLALHVLKPLTGEATILYDPADARASYQRVSPDGRYVAFARYQTTGGPDGIWLIDVASGSLRQLVAQAPGDTNATPMTGWSDDGQWLAYAAPDMADLGGFGGKVFLVNVVDGRRVTVGRGFLADWRAREPRLVFSAQTGKGDQGAYGATASTYDLGGQKTRELFSIDPGVTQVAWNPVRDEFLYVARTTGCPFQSTVWVQPLVGAARRVGTIATAKRAWWSADGTTILALVPGKGMDADLVDAASGRKIATITDAGPTRACP